MPKLIVVSGFSASGKTTLTARLSKEFELPSFSKDDFKELLADTIGFTDHESTLTFGRSAFTALFLVAKRLLENKVSLIIEGNFSLGEETLQFIEFLKSSNTEVYEILCFADGPVLVERFLARKRHPVHHTLGDEKLQAYFDRTMANGKDTPLGLGKLLELDTTDPASINYDEILRFVGSGV